MSEIVLRDARTDDAAQMCAVMKNKMVAAQQFRQSNFGELQIAMEKLFSSDFLGEPATIQYSVIDVDSKVAGYILHTHEKHRSINQVSFGWNLLPEYWGKGIMASSLSVLFDQLISAGVLKFKADYFKGNERCKQMLIRLGFQGAGIGFLERIELARTQRCLRWILRMELSPNQWSITKEILPPSLKVESQCKNFLKLYDV